MLRRPGLRCGAGGDTSEAALTCGGRSVCPRPQWGAQGSQTWAPPPLSAMGQTIWVEVIGPQGGSPHSEASKHVGTSPRLQALPPPTRDRRPQGSLRPHGTADRSGLRPHLTTGRRAFGPLRLKAQAPPPTAAPPQWPKLGSPETQPQLPLLASRAPGGPGAPLLKYLARPQPRRLGQGGRRWRGQGAEGEGMGVGEGVWGGRGGGVLPGGLQRGGAGSPEAHPRSPAPGGSEPRRRCRRDRPAGPRVGVGAVPGAGASGDGKSEWGAGPRYGKADAQRRAPLSVSQSWARLPGAGFAAHGRATSGPLLPALLSLKSFLHQYERGL